MAEKKWYVVQTYSGYENKAKKSLEEKIRKEGLSDLFGQIRLDGGLDVEKFIFRPGKVLA